MARVMDIVKNIYLILSLHNKKPIKGMATCPEKNKSLLK